MIDGKSSVSLFVLVTLWYRGIVLTATGGGGQWVEETVAQIACFGNVGIRVGSGRRGFEVVVVKDGVDAGGAGARWRVEGGHGRLGIHLREDWRWR